MKEKKSKSEKSEKTKVDSKKERRKKKKLELWSLYDDLTLGEKFKESQTQTEQERDDRDELLARLTVANEELEKYKKRLDQLMVTAKREVKNLKKSRDEFRTKCEELENAKRRHRTETPKYLFEIFSSKYGFANATNLTQKEKERKTRRLLAQRMGEGKGPRFDPEIKRNIRDYTEQDYFRLFYQKDHAATQTSETSKKFRSKGSCTRDDGHFIRESETQTDFNPERSNKNFNSERSNTEVNPERSKQQNEAIKSPEMNLSLSSVASTLSSDLDEFSSCLRNSIPNSSAHADMLQKADIGRNMKTRVQFDSETLEFSETLCPATPAYPPPPSCENSLSSMDFFKLRNETKVPKEPEPPRQKDVEKDKVNTQKEMEKKVPDETYNKNPKRSKNDVDKQNQKKPRDGDESKVQKKARNNNLMDKNKVVESKITEKSQNKPRKEDEPKLQKETQNEDLSNKDKEVEPVVEKAKKKSQTGIDTKTQKETQNKDPAVKEKEALPEVSKKISQIEVDKKVQKKNQSPEKGSKFPTDKKKEVEAKANKKSKIVYQTKVEQKFQQETEKLSHNEKTREKVKSQKDAKNLEVKKTEKEHQIRPSQIENKATIISKLREVTPQKGAVGSSKRKSQTPKKLTPDRNQSPRKTRKRKKSAEKPPPEEPPPKRSPIRLVVDKHSDNSPASEDSRPPSTPFAYVTKDTEPYSPFSVISNNEANKTDEPVADETEARSSFSPVPPLPDDPGERIKFLELELTCDTRVAPRSLNSSASSAATVRTKSPQPDSQELTKRLGLELSDTKQPPERQNWSPANSPSIAKRNIFNTENKSPVAQWAKAVLSLLDQDQNASARFEETPNAFLAAITRHVDVEAAANYAVKICQSLPLPQKETQREDDSDDSLDSLLDYQFNDFSMPPISN